MESTNPTPPPLVHDGASSSRSVPDEPAARTRDGDDSAGSGGIELAQFQEMLVRAMRDPRVRSAVLPGATRHDVVSCPAPSNAKSEKGSGQTCIGPVSQRNVQ